MMATEFSAIDRQKVLIQIVENIKAEDKALGRHFGTTPGEYLDMALTLYNNGFRPVETK